MWESIFVPHCDCENTKWVQCVRNCGFLKLVLVTDSREDLEMAIREGKFRSDQLSHTKCNHRITSRHSALLQLPLHHPVRMLSIYQLGSISVVI